MVAADATGILGFLKGDFDFLGWSVSPLLADKLILAPERHPHAHLFRSYGRSVATLLLNLRNYPFDLLEFRQALNYAVDREDMTMRLFRGYAQVAPRGLMTPRMGDWYNEAPGSPAYDPERAKQLLDQLGFIDTDGDGVRELPDGEELSFTLYCSVAKTEVEAAGLIAYFLRQVGIRIRIEPVSPDAMDVTLKGAAFDLALHTIAAFMVPDMLFFYFHSSRGVIKEGTVVGFNRGGFNDPEMDAALEELRMALTTEEKKAAAHRVQALLAAQIPRIPLYIADFLEVYRDDDLTGWAPNTEEGVMSDETVLNLVEAE